MIVRVRLGTFYSVSLLFALSGCTAEIDEDGTPPPRAEEEATSGGAPSEDGSSFGATGGSSFGGNPSGGSGGTMLINEPTDGVGGASLPASGGADSGGTGGSAIEAETGCEAGAYLVCEDFESATIDTEQWDIQGTQAELSLEHAAGGSQALKLTFTPGSTSPHLRLKEIPEQLRSHLFGRVYVWSAEPYPAVRYPGDNYDTQQHVEFFRARSNAPTDYMGYAAGVVGQMRLTSPNDSFVGLGDFVAKKSMCLEWEFDANRRYAQGFLTVDGTSTGQESPPEGSSNWQLPEGATTFTEMLLGLVVITSTTPAMHVWIDEFALDTERIGCDP